jgi:hypothetical protein
LEERETREGTEDHGNDDGNVRSPKQSWENAEGKHLLTEETEGTKMGQKNCHRQGKSHPV